jgi:hypothetical protein
MALEGVVDVFAEYRESLAEQSDTSLADEQAKVSTDAAFEQDAGSYKENASEDTGYSGSVSDHGGRVKIAAEASTAGVSYDFGQ